MYCPTTKIATITEKTIISDVEDKFPMKTENLTIELSIIEAVIMTDMLISITVLLTVGTTN